DRLKGVLQAKKVAFGFAGIFFRRCTEFLQHGDATGVGIELQRILVIAQEAELVHGKQTPSPSRVARNENQVTVLYAHRRPLQVIVDLGRLSVFIGTEERNIQIVAGKE